MDKEEIIEVILDHFEDPRNFGKLKDYDIAGSGINQWCGDKINIYIKVDLNNQEILDASFEGKGCVISQATASMLLEKIKGFSLETVRSIDSSEIEKLIGKELVRKRPQCSMLALETLKKAILTHQRNE